MQNFIQAGENVTVTAAATAASGAGVKIGDLFGIAAGDAETGDSLVLVTAGVFDMPKVAVDDFTLGAAVYWDDAAKLVTVTSAGNTKIGVAVSVAGNGAASVRVRLNGAF
jgi:predicted RecA/RadA family phage recombinase